jgi:octaprenyl-diphosphate synthase
MSRLPRRLERALGLGDLVGDDLAAEDALSDVLGRIRADELRELRDLDRLRVRPILVSLSARAAGAAAVDPDLQHTAELLHLALTMHDLALGQPGGLRRRAARRVLKRVSGSHLTVRALELSRHISPPDILGEAVDTLRSFADGEALSRELRETGAVPDVRHVEEHADVHHGALLAFCCRAGAHVANADIGTVAALGRYGRHVGGLWTLADDLLALSGDEAAEHLIRRAETGRPVLAVAVAAGRDERIGDAYRELVRAPDLHHARPVLDGIRVSGGLAATREAMARSSWSAQQALRALPDTPYRQALDGLAAGLARAS